MDVYGFLVVVMVGFLCVLKMVYGIMMVETTRVMMMNASQSDSVKLDVRCRIQVGAVMRCCCALRFNFSSFGFLVASCKKFK